ncbi:Mitochondrial folate transporter/carrier [Portunus trituberculatus]|uniref:Mitochondrial folate transporter/carrier n=1 Tax=Portunus trituberculatus TaxID=210409 RepID=A0A5B7EZU5_PORTR|nr:Mitochondrial folate transporter/carrier [Portunus trituberculatus]
MQNEYRNTPWYSKGLRKYIHNIPHTTIPPLIYPTPLFPAPTLMYIVSSHSYNTIKSWLQGGNSKVHLGPGLHMVAAAEAGVLTLVMTNPIWVVKTRLCLQYTEGAGAGAAASATHYNGMVDALVKTYKHEGVRGLYKGFVPGVFGVSHGALQFMAYEEMKAQYNRYRSLPIDSKLLFAAVTTYPYQVLRARMQDQHAQYDNLRHCIKETWRGLSPNLMRVVPATAITFLVYEKTSEFLFQLRSTKDPPATVTPARDQPASPAHQAEAGEQQDD